MTNNSEEIQEFTKLVERFVEVANEMKNEGKRLTTINAALMSASATYGSYIAAGNVGYLQPSGVDKLVDAYRHHALRVQEIKKAIIQSSGQNIDQDPK
jgi:fatty acid-binding protein DegV